MSRICVEPNLLRSLEKIPKEKTLFRASKREDDDRRWSYGWSYNLDEEATRIQKIRGGAVRASDARIIARQHEQILPEDHRRSITQDDVWYNHLVVILMLIPGYTTPQLASSRETVPGTSIARSYRCSYHVRYRPYQVRER